MLRSATVETIIATCIYIACRAGGYPRTFDEVSYYTSTPAVAIAQQHNSIARVLKLDTGRIRPELLVNRYGSSLRMGNHKIIRNAELMCQQLDANHLLDTPKPQAVAAAAIFLSCLLLKTPVDIEKLSRKAFISLALLKSTYRQLYEVRIAAIPQSLQSGADAVPLTGLPETITTQAAVNKYCERHQQAHPRQERGKDVLVQPQSIRCQMQIKMPRRLESIADTPAAQSKRRKVES